MAIHVPTEVERALARMTLLHQDAEPLIDLLEGYGMDAAIVLDVIERAGVIALFYSHMFPSLRED